MKDIKSKQYGESDINLSLETLAEINRESSSVLFIDDTGTILGTSEKIWDRYPHLSVIKMFEKLRKRRKKAEAEFEERGRILKLRGKPVKNVFMLEIEDITSQTCIEDFKKKIISTISHELKTPLTIIKGYAELLSFETDSDVLDKMSAQIERIINIVNSISLLMKGQEGELVEINVENVVEEIAHQFEDKIAFKGIDFQIDIEDGLKIKAEKILFQQMIINLLDNAIKFTEKGKVGIKGYKSEENIVIEVYDTGRGIPEDLQPFIFEKFVKAEESPGLGIGLSLVRTIVKHHGWEIELNSAAGKGTTFFVKIPVNS
ncbi:sensor histidine kinase [Desulfurobacterium sp.]